MNNQQQHMAAMAGLSSMGGPVDGNPGPGQIHHSPQATLDTYIYDYFLRNKHYDIAKGMLDNDDVKLQLQKDSPKQSPGRRNGINPTNGDDKGEHNLPLPMLPQGQCVDNSFLLDWWVQFWEIFHATRNQKNGLAGKPYVQYTGHVRQMHQMNNEMRSNRLMMNNPGMNNPHMQNMMRQMPGMNANGIDPSGMKRFPPGMVNRNANGAGPMGAMNLKQQALQHTQMQRDASGMGINGDRPNSPGSAENAPSPNKRPRVEGAMNVGAMGGNGNQFNDFAQQGSTMQQDMKTLNPAAQGSPMNQEGLVAHTQDMFAGNTPRVGGLAGGGPGGQGQPSHSTHALQDYQMQLMLLEQQNKKRLLMARQEQETTSHPQPSVGGGPTAQFAQGMSPQGSRPGGPSPNPADMVKRGTPKLNQQGLPGSPMPDASMQPQRNSPAPAGFNNMDLPNGIPPQYPNHGPYQIPMQNPMQMRQPPSSHPAFQGSQQLTQQQMEQLRQGMPNGAMQNGVMQNGGMPNGMPNGMWRPTQQMMPGQPPQLGNPMNNPQQNRQMPPPPAPPTNEQPRAQEPSPSQPAPAPPTPSQTNKGNPKKKNAAKDNKKAPKAKGASNAAPAAPAEDAAPTPTPSTPITPMHKNSFNQNGQQPNNQQPPMQTQQPLPPPPQPTMDNNPPFGNIDDPSYANEFTLDLGPYSGDLNDDFNFEQFLETGDATNGFGADNFTFDNETLGVGDL